MYGEIRGHAMRLMDECDYSAFWKLVEGIDRVDKAWFARDFILRNFPVAENGAFNETELTGLLDAIYKRIDELERRDEDMNE